MSLTVFVQALTFGAIFPRDDNAALAREFVYKISAAYNSLDLYKHVTASVHLYNLLTLMSRCCISALKNLDAGVAKLVPAIQYIKANYDNSDLTSEMIASHSGISHPHLCRLFSAVYSMTPHEFLLNTRLGQAKAMLTENKNIPIRLIAQNTGFSSASYFTKVFKAKTGFTPAQFRHQTVYDF